MLSELRHSPGPGDPPPPVLVSAELSADVGEAVQQLAGLGQAEGGHGGGEEGRARAHYVSWVVEGGNISQSAARAASSLLIVTGPWTCCRALDTVPGPHNTKL